MQSNFLKFVNLWLKISFTLSITYFTSWVFFIHILYHLGIFKMFQYSLLILSIIVSIIGLFITYVHPKKIYIPIIDRNIDNKELILYDFIFHQLPLIVLLLVYNVNIKNDNTIFAISLIVIYLLLFNPIEIYKI